MSDIFPSEKSEFGEVIEQLRIKAGALTIRETIEAVDGDPVAIRRAMKSEQPWDPELAQAVIIGLRAYIHQQRTRTFRALCCTCGTLRTLKASYSGRRMDDATEAPMGPKFLAESQNRGSFTGVEPYWRFIRVLKCAECQDWIQHALILDGDERADDSEWVNYGRDLRRERLDAWREERANE